MRVAGRKRPIPRVTYAIFSERLARQAAGKLSLQDWVTAYVRVPDKTRQLLRCRLKLIQTEEDGDGASPSRKSEEEKRITGRRLNQACRPCATPSSSSSSDCRLSEARIAEDSALQRRLSKSTKGA